MSGGLILLLAFFVPYVVLNVRRLVGGKRWAFTACQVAKEWETREHARLAALREAKRP